VAKLTDRDVANQGRVDLHLGDGLLMNPAHPVSVVCMQTKERERVPHLEEGNQEFLDAHVLEAALASALERCTARHSDDDCTSMYLVSRTDQLAINGRIVRGWGLLDERLAIVGALLEELALAARGTADRVNGRRNEARHRV
jgi:hypothetical protein